MTLIILGRHADSEHTEDGDPAKFGGRMNDCPLGKKNGVRQSQQLSQAWGKAGIRLDAIYSSIAVRATATAKPTAERFGLSVHTIEELQEIYRGDWEGEPRSIQDKEPFGTQRWDQGFNFRPPGKGAESHNDVRERGLRALWRIHEESQREGYECVAVFSHLNVIKNVVREPMGWRTPEKQDEAVVDVCSATTVAFQSQGKLRVVEFNRQLI